MQRRPSPPVSTVGLISIILLYVTLTVLILFFARQLLNEISQGTVLARFIFLPLAVLLPLTLVGMVMYNIIRLVQQRKKGLPGSRFKVKLVIFFTFISILAAIPQGILSLSFIRTAMDSWFSSQLNTAIEGGLQIALDYNRTTVDDLEDFSKNDLLPPLVRDTIDRPDQLWSTINSLYPPIDGVQVFTKEGQSLLFRGSRSAFMQKMPPSGISGILPREKIGTVSIVRARSSTFTLNTPEGNEEVSLVFSVILPSGFDKKAENLTAALQMFSQYYEFRNTFFFALLVFYSLFSFPILLLSILTGFLLSDEITRPVVHLEEAIQRVSNGDFSFRILSRSGDELKILVQSFNTMISELEHSRNELRQTEKVTAWQEIAQRMAHEIKNPLTPIKLSAQRIQRTYEKQSPNMKQVIESSVQSITDEIDNLTELLAEFRDFARMPTPHFQPTEIVDSILEVLDIYQAQYSRVEVRTLNLRPMQVAIDRSQMNRVFSNVIKNAFEAIPDQKGTISITTDLVRKGHTHYCRIKIEDSGVGITRELEQKVFHPYFTTKENGTGLGLPIVERIIADHQGRIWFETEENIGTTFFIDLPMEQD